MPTEPRQRILLITRNLPPLVGGMERLNWHMAEALAGVAEVRVIGPEGAAALAPAGVIVREAPLKPLQRFLWRARGLARREAKAWSPAMVLAGSGLTAPLARTAARVCGARTSVYVHGLDLAVKHPVYRSLWLPAIRRMDRIIANSHATAELCRGIGTDPACVGIVHPGVDLPETRPDVRAATDFRSRYGLADRPLLLSVGRLSARKGLREFVARALPRIVAAHPDVMLLIMGDAPANALHFQAQTRETIQAAADALSVGSHLKFLGSVSDSELGVLYRAANVHIFPVREIAGNPEGFGMVAVEAAAHGLPTVAFATGGVVDAVAECQSGHLVESGDYSAFADAVVQTLAERETLRPGCTAFAQRFAWPVFGERLAAQLQLRGGGDARAADGARHRQKAQQ